MAPQRAKTGDSGMDQKAHPLLRKAQRDANRFKILPADWGFILWRQSDHSAWMWRRLAQTNDKAALEDLACERLARLVSD